MKNSEYYRDQTEIVVEQGQWGYAEGNQILATYGLGPCIGVAAYDPQTTRGHMAHIQDAVQETELIAEFLGTVIQSSPNVADIQFWVRGGELIPDRQLLASCKAGRVQIIKDLAAAGIRSEKTDVLWIPLDAYSTSLSLDCKTGELQDTFNYLGEDDWQAYDNE